MHIITFYLLPNSTVLKLWYMNMKQSKNKYTLYIYRVERKIVALEKTTWFHFRLIKTSFLFLLQTIY